MRVITYLRYLRVHGSKVWERTGYGPDNVLNLS